MPQIPSEKWNSLLLPYVGEPLGAALLQKLEIYLELLLRWNAKMNLTAIRDPEAIIQRHFGESLFLARHLQNVPRGTSGAGQILPRGTFLDHGSGAGFPGLPTGLFQPDVQVTLSESQQKKASFLQEVVRATEAVNIQVHYGRTEAVLIEKRFDWVALRAVDDAASAYPIAAARVAPGGFLVALEALDSFAIAELAARGLEVRAVFNVPNARTVLRFYSRQAI